MPLMDVWVVRVTVHQPRMRVLVRMRLAGLRAQRVHLLAMCVVHVRVGGSSARARASARGARRDVARARAP